MFDFYQKGNAKSVAVMVVYQAIVANSIRFSPLGKNFIISSHRISGFSSTISIAVRLSYQLRVVNRILQRYFIGFVLKLPSIIFLQIALNDIGAKLCKTVQPSTYLSIVKSTGRDTINIRILKQSTD